MATDNIASSVMQTLGGGSGIDIVKLARDFNDVEKLPAEEKLLCREAAKQNFRLSGLKFNVQALIDEFNGLNDASELATPTATTLIGRGLRGINRWFRPKWSVRYSCGCFGNRAKKPFRCSSSSSQSINGGSGFTINITIPETTGTTTAISVAAGSDTPTGVVSAINAAGLGISATNGAGYQRHPVPNYARGSNRSCQ